MTNMSRIRAVLLTGLVFSFYRLKKRKKLGVSPAMVNRLKSISPDHQQLILVTAQRDGTSSAWVQMFDRKIGGKFRLVKEMPGIIGKNGFLSDFSEGSKGTPIGLFPITQAFGRKENPGTRMPYHKITEDDIWVDNPGSPYYNTLQSMSRTGESSEKMNNPLYDYGFVIDYNRKERIPGKGSAIFFHIAGGDYTLGCTGVSEPDVLSVLRWLDPARKPVILQAPVYELTKFLKQTLKNDGQRKGKAMHHITKVSLIGMGAIGCAYGHKLCDLLAGNLRVIADKERANRYEKDGLIINGQRYDFHYVSPDEKVEPADLVIVAVKSTQLEQAIQDMRHHVGEHTIIMSLLNGISSEETIAKTFGKDKLLYSLCNGIDANREGNHVDFSTYGIIYFGEATHTANSEKVQRVKDLFDRAGLPYEIPENMMRALWYKFMTNVGINQASAVTRGKYGTFQTNEYARDLMISAMREVIRLSEKAGIGLNEQDIQKQLNVFARMNPQGRTSMLQDIESGRKTEVEIFSGTVLRLGKKYGVPTPVNKTLYRIIKTIESSF
ncbi:2-dehydropantoate 2-reductase [Sporolactobacillus sp. THM7-4]|nr:2-dehydropantoate 2-reductase [Sporolactobacillus sp. THM7-4]